jgi:hypothetical protein
MNLIIRHQANVKVHASILREASSWHLVDQVAMSRDARMTRTFRVRLLLGLPTRQVGRFFHSRRFGN